MPELTLRFLVGGYNRDNMGGYTYIYIYMGYV